VNSSSHRPPLVDLAAARVTGSDWASTGVQQQERQAAPAETSCNQRHLQPSPLESVLLQHTCNTFADVVEETAACRDDVWAKL